MIRILLYPDITTCLNCNLILVVNDENLIQNARELGHIFRNEIQKMQEEFDDFIFDGEDEVIEDWKEDKFQYGSMIINQPEKFN